MAGSINQGSKLMLVKLRIACNMHLDRRTIGGETKTITHPRNTLRGCFGQGVYGSGHIYIYMFQTSFLDPLTYLERCATKTKKLHQTRAPEDLMVTSYGHFSIFSVPFSRL